MEAVVTSWPQQSSIGSFSAGPIPAGAFGDYTSAIPAQNGHSALNVLKHLTHSMRTHDSAKQVLGPVTATLSPSVAEGVDRTVECMQVRHVLNTKHVDGEGESRWIVYRAEGLPPLRAKSLIRFDGLKISWGADTGLPPPADITAYWIGITSPTYELLGNPPVYLHHTHVREIGGDRGNGIHNLAFQCHGDTQCHASRGGLGCQLFFAPANTSWRWYPNYVADGAYVITQAGTSMVPTIAFRVRWPKASTKPSQRIAMLDGPGYQYVEPPFGTFPINMSSLFATWATTSLPFSGKFVRQFIHTHERAFRGFFMFNATPAQLGLETGENLLKAHRFANISSRGYPGYKEAVSLLELQSEEKLDSFWRELLVRAQKVGGADGSLKCFIAPSRTNSSSSFPYGEGLELTKVSVSTSSSPLSPSTNSLSFSNMLVDRFVPLSCRKWEFQRGSAMTAVGLFGLPLPVAAAPHLMPASYKTPGIFLQHMSVRGFVIRTDGSEAIATCLEASNREGKAGMPFSVRKVWEDCG